MQELTVKEYAARERVSARTVRTWIRKGAVSVRRTPGGGVRVLIVSVQETSERKNAEEIGSLNQ